MALIALSSFQIYPAVNGGYDPDNLEVRWWYNRGFIDSTTAFVQGGNGQSGFYITSACTVNGSGIITVPSTDLFSTLDAIDPAPQSIQLFGRLYSNNTPKQWITAYSSTPQGWVVQNSTPLTYEDLVLENQAIVLANPPLTFPTFAQMVAYIDSLVPTPLASEVVIGRSRLSVAPVDALDPIAAGDNDPRLGSYINILTYGAATTNTAAQNTVAIGNAVIAAAALGAGLYWPVGYFPLNNITISVPVQFAPGASGPRVATGQTVTLTKSLAISDVTKHFDNALGGQGAISFAGNTSLAEVWPMWWGGAGDATLAGVGTDNYPAWLACMAAVATLDVEQRGLAIKYPFGRFYFSSTLIPTRQVVIQGVNPMNDIGATLVSGQFSGGGTLLYFADGVDGIDITAPGGGVAAGLSQVLNLSVVSKGKTGATAHGIVMTTRGQVDGVLAWGFKGNGCRIIANLSDVPATNANRWRIANSAFLYNGTRGLSVEVGATNPNNGDTNAGMAMFVDCSYNGTGGFYEGSYLGNTYIGCHSSGNTGPGFETKPAVPGILNKNTIIGQYEEANSAASKIYSPAVVVGGTWASGFSTDSDGALVFADPATGELKLMIGTTVNTFQNVGLTLKQDADSMEILTLKRDFLAHGMTSITDTDTYTSLFPNDGANGGLGLSAFTATNRAMLMQAFATTEVTSQGSGDFGAIQFNAFKKSGTSAGALGSSANLMSLANASTNLFWWLANGTFKAATLSASTAVQVSNVGKLSTAPRTSNVWGATLLLDVSISNHDITAVFATSATCTITPSGTGSAGDWLFIDIINGAGGSVVVTFASTLHSSGTQTTGASHYSSIAFKSTGLVWVQQFRTDDLA